MIPKRRKRESFGTREPMQIRSSGHLAWVRGHECACRSNLCEGKIEAAHVRAATDGGTGLKPGDNWTLALCSGHHRYQHQVGEGAFSAIYGIDMKAIAAELWKRSPHGIRWRAEHP